MATHQPRGHDRACRRRGRGAGPLRLDSHGRSSSRTPARTCRACSPTTSSAAARADDGDARPGALRLFAEGVPTDETAGARPPSASRVGGENDSPARAARAGSSPRSPRTAPPAWTSGSSTGRDRFLRGGDHISFLERGFPAARFTEPNENFAHQHQDVRVENGVQFGDLPQFCDFDYIARVARVNAATLWSLANAPGTPEERAGRHRRAHQRHRADLDRQPRARTSPLRGGVAADDRGRLDARDRRRPGRRTRDIDLSKDNVFFGVRAVDRDRHPQPGRVPDADPVAGQRAARVRTTRATTSSDRSSRPCRCANVSSAAPARKGDSAGTWSSKPCDP